MSKPIAIETAEFVHDAVAIRTVDPSDRAYGGFQWPGEIGAVVECPDWSNRPRCGNGFHALLDGIGDWALTYRDGGMVWQVVGVIRAECVSVDDDKVKFPRCRLLYRGDKNGALAMIVPAMVAAIQAGAEGKIATGYRGHAAATGDSGHAAATGYRGHAAATGDRGHAAATGDSGHAAATGYSGHAAATGDRGHAAATGYSGHAAATGYSGHAAATGDSGHAAATGDRGHAAATGDRGHAAATGDRGHAAATGDSGHAAATGYTVRLPPPSARSAPPRPASRAPSCSLIMTRAKFPTRSSASAPSWWANMASRPARPIA
jgi:hypothetical protein